MARFSDLPNEMVTEIWKHVLAPEDVESFARVCKKVHGQASSFLRLHRQLRHQYSTFSNESTKNLGDDRDRGWGVPVNRPSNLLKEILASPRIGLYVRELRLESWFSEWEPPSSATSRSSLVQRFLHYPYSDEAFAIFKNTLSDTILETILQAWILELEDGNEDVIMALLFLAAPNILKIELGRDWDGIKRFQRVMHCLATDTKPEVPAALRNLKHISFGGGTIDVPFDSVTFAASLPSLDSIDAKYIFTTPYEHDFSCLPPRTSDVKALNFKRSSIGLAELNELLQGFKALESFAYIQPCCSDSYVVDPYFPELYFDPTAMCTTLLAHTKSSLTSLHIRTQIEEGGTWSVCMRGLGGFENLKHIEISLCLIANCNNPVVVSDWPSSVETISVRDVSLGNMCQLKRLISKIIKTRVARVPRLETLALHIEGFNAGSFPLYDTMRDKCESAGFALRILDEPEAKKAGRIFLG